MINKDRAVDVGWMDFNKVFIKVAHGSPSWNFGSLGNQGELVNQLQIWHSGQNQRMVVKGCWSNRWSVISGVLQESVLGAMLCVIYINELNGGCYHGQ